MKVLKSRFTESTTYKLRYLILYIVVGALLLGSIIALPELTGMRLSDAERASALVSSNSELSLLNFPYHFLQGLSLRLLGFTPFAIKLPSIILGLLTAILLTMLLNRWYRNLTAFTTTILIVSSAAFLTLTSVGTPSILYLLFPVLILWFGSQIIDERPRALVLAALSIVVLISLFIPYMIYFDLALAALVVIHPHLRFSLNRVPKSALIIAAILALAIILPLIILTPNLNPLELIRPNFALAQNASAAWKQIIGFGEPLSWFSLPVLLLAAIGVYSSILNYHLARNYIVFLLILLSVAASLLWPALFPLAILLFTLLAGNGLSFLIKHWRGIFPHNVYATLAALAPLVAFCLMTAVGSVNFYVAAPRTIASIHYAADTDFQLLEANLMAGDALMLERHADFYAQAFPDYPQTAEANASRIIADHPLTTDRVLERVITNSSATASARFYLYK